MTGHQTTLSSIPWEAAFSVFQGDHGTYLLPASLVLSHTFAGQILVTLCLPLMLVTSFHCQQRYERKKEQISEFFLFHCDQTATLFANSLDRLLRRFVTAQLVVVSLFGYSTGFLVCT